MGALNRPQICTMSYIDTQDGPLCWQVFPSAIGTILAAGFGVSAEFTVEAELGVQTKLDVQTGPSRRLVFLGIDSSFCAVEKDFTHWARVQKKCAIEQRDWLGDLLPALQHCIAKCWGGPSNESQLSEMQLNGERLDAGQSFPFNLLPFPLRLWLWGTPFQVRVWRALLDIPYGHTVSYSALADHLGYPAAVRAVASAVAANPISLWLPCHRIVQKNGQKGQYHWGRVLKQQLLSVEVCLFSSSFLFILMIFS